MRLLFLPCLVLFTLGSYAQNSSWQDLIVDPNSKFSEIQESFNIEWKNRDYVKGKGWKQFKRWESFWEHRLLPNGDFPDFSKGLNEFNLFKSEFQLQQVEQNVWEPIGPINYEYGESWSPGQGRVNCIIEDPTNSQILYVGTPSGGVWKSYDGGNNWDPITDELSVLGISHIEINPINTDELYIATGDADGGDTYSIGIWKSLDAGLTWVQTSFPEAQCNRLVIDPNNTEVIWASSNYGLYKSLDSGQNWNLLYDGNIKDLKICPNDPSKVYFCNSSVMYYTHDGGETFSISTGLTGDITRICITTTSANPSIVYIVTSGSEWGFNGVFRSTNYGQNFVLQNNTTDIFDGSSQAYYDMAITASDTDENFIVAGVLNLWKSYDGGINWENVNSWSNPEQESYTHADIHYLEYFDDRLYCGSDGGIYKSENNALSFTDLSGELQIGQFYKISSNQNDPYKISGGLQDNGGYYFDSNDWIVWHGADGMESIINPYNSSEVFGMIQFGGLYYSNSSGQNYVNYDSPEEGLWITPMQFDSLNNKILAGYSQLYSHNLINGWQQISDYSFPSLISQIEIFQQNSDSLYLSAGNKLFLSTDGGYTILPIEIPFYSNISSIEVHPENSSKIWITKSGWYDSEKIYYSADAGSTWTDLSYNLPNLPINVVKYDKSGHALYVGMDVGVYYLNLDLNIWMIFNNELPNVIVNDIEINDIFNDIYLGTYGRGVWQTDLFDAETENLQLYSYNIDSINDIMCTDLITPIASYVNIGSQVINHVKVMYDINGIIDFVDWNGEISNGGLIEIEIPLNTLTDGEHTIEVELVEVNNLDYELGSTLLQKTFYVFTNSEDVEFTLATDCYANETSFALFDSSNNLIYQNNSDFTDNSLNTYEFCLNPECYYIEIYDSYGDGIEGTLYDVNCTDGYFYLTDQNGDILFEMDDPNFGYTSTYEFCVEESIFGCTDSTASNFNSIANISEPSCLYEDYIFCEDFESYIENTMLAENSLFWETWTSHLFNNPPYGDDILVTSNGQSLSGINALYFPQSSIGGPQDIVLPISQQETLTDLYLEISFNFFIESGAYMNFQSTHTPGDWLLNLIIDESGGLSLTDGGNIEMFSSEVDLNTWTNFTFRFDLIQQKLYFDLNQNLIFESNIDFNQLGAVNFYNIENNAFWVDDVCYIIDSDPYGCNDNEALNYNPEAHLFDANVCCYAVDDIQISCGTYTWIDGEIYTTSGLYEFQTVNSNGCDSVIVLNLTILENSSSETNYETCDSYLWNSELYNESGTYTYQTENSIGCDSVATLNLSILETSSSEIINVNNCDSSYYFFGGNEYISSGGPYVDSLINIYGCDSIVYLTITFNNSSSSYDTIISFDFEYYDEINDIWHYEPGDYTDTLINSLGCDSILNLNLTFDCIEDLDQDEVCDEEDNCIEVVNPNQEDIDNDGEGDACDYDDGIGIEELDLVTPQLIKIIDVLGREQKEYNRGSLLFYFYDNGSVEMKFIP
jgi:photosystem II stability/assembly factor-like uncharacterized protein